MARPATGPRLGAIVLLPEPVAAHVQAWRRALRDPARDLIPPHLTLVPPQAVAAGGVEAAVALVDRAAAMVAPGLIELRGAATFLPHTPVTFLVVTEGGSTLRALERALRAPPLDQRAFPFHPHVTVAQDRPPHELESAVRELARFHAVFPLPEVTLTEADESAGWKVLHQASVGGSGLVREVPLAEAVSAAVFLFDGSRVLLGRRTPRPDRRHPGVWDAPGGKREPGEPLLGALVREAREEAGVEPLGAAPLGCFHDGERADAFYLATAWRGEASNQDLHEHSRLEWMALERMAGLPLAPTTRRALARLLEVLGWAG
ncbi:MAG TPA: 2'-5' RNA ligase family protein [Actinomycetes bacterium]|nr:2'-5' RNA ligase family protein [Actinomycetes bacterium]